MGYCLRSHASAYNQAETVAWSRRRTPLLAVPGHIARAPVPGVEVDPSRAFVTAWKPADGAGLILRVWETAGQSAPLTISTRGFRKAVATDLLERDQHPIPITEGRVSVDLRAHGFVVVRFLP